MSHVEQGELQAYLDGEVTTSARAQIDSHIQSCGACAEQLEQLRSAATLFAFMMRGSDAPAPTAAALAEIQTVVPDVPRRRFALTRSALTRAAIFMVGFAALASAAIPGSPVRSWLSNALQTVGVIDKAPAPAVVPAVPAPTEATANIPTDEAALAIQPADGHVRVILTNVLTGATIRVRLIDGERATVQALGGATRARFRTGPGRIEVIGVQKGEVAVEIPRSAWDARVEADGRMLFQKDREKVRVADPAQIGTNSEFVFKPRR